ncbi:sensor domain-containing diguanylate cyclase [Pseudescherichia sp.]|uniref:sensor domain-containing diguanylate cyclase n=1 Tax=Pseudescherichia sp. TaxID=2055881 RepID=UPI0028AA756B|nr:sensor domain-containing diguanylate cyclase [Pseudescherichia sp.]
MKFPGVPVNEKERLKSLYMMDLLDKKDDERLLRLTRLAKATFDVPIALITLLDRDRQWMISCDGLNMRQSSRNVSFCAHAILLQGIMIVKDTLKDDRFDNNPLVHDEPFVRFYAGCPVRLPDGSIAGTICLIDNKPRDFSSEEINLLLDLGAIVEDELVIIGMAMTDKLTELPNRRGFFQIGDKRFAELTRDATPFTLLYFVVEDLQSLNDIWGHAEGDNALRAFAKCLNSCMKSGDVCGRVDSSGFAVLLAHNGQNDADAFLFNLQAKIDDWYSHVGKKYPLNYSYGMLENSTEKYDDLVDMLKDADTVMYSEKRKGR